MMSELIAEVFGTFVLILLGDGVVANVGLAPRVASAGYNWNTITFGWAFAVVVAVYTVGGVSGAHINPAVTFALALKRGFPWAKVVPPGSPKSSALSSAPWASTSSTVRACTRQACPTCGAPDRALPSAKRFGAAWRLRARLERLTASVPR